MNRLGIVKSVLTGKAVPYANGSISAIDKRIQNEVQTVSPLGFINDEQGDPKYHGGLDKALHIYPLEHYQQWRKELGNKSMFMKAGAFGENISSLGISESNVCIGDQIAIGTSVLQITQGRMPCWKLNIRCKQPDMSLRLQKSLRTGWYFRVLEEGEIGPGDRIELMERTYPEWPLSRVMRSLFEGCTDVTKLEKMLHLPLVASWENLIKKRIETREVEDWSHRLFG